MKERVSATRVEKRDLDAVRSRPLRLEEAIATGSVYNFAATSEAARVLFSEVTVGKRARDLIYSRLFTERHRE